jgi:excisionase family DNA binding protein
VLTTQQAADVLGVTRRRVRQMIAQGTLPALKFGRDYQIREGDAEALRDRPGRWKRERER